AQLRARPARAGLPGTGRRGGRATVRRARSGDRPARRQRGLRDAFADRARAKLRGRASNRHEPAREPPHAEREEIADDQVGDVMLTEIDDRELLQERIGDADRPEPRPPAPDDERDERRPGAVQRWYRRYGVVVEQPREQRRVGDRGRPLVPVLEDPLEGPDEAVAGGRPGRRGGEDEEPD